MCSQSYKKFGGEPIDLREGIWDERTLETGVQLLNIYFIEKYTSTVSGDTNRHEL